MQAGNQDEAITSINITPLVDVALVLVIIFMITMPYLMEKALKIRSSAEKVVQVSSIKDPILVEMTSRGIQVEGKMVAVDQLAGTLAGIIKQRGIDAVAVSAEPQIKHGLVVEVLDQVMESGAQDLDLLDPADKQRADAAPAAPARTIKMAKARR